MQRDLVVAVTGLLVVAAALSGADATGEDATAQAVTLWKQMCAADVSSEEFKAAQWRLTSVIDEMPATRHMAAAAGMMDMYADPAVNAAAVEVFGADALPITDVQRILWDGQRSRQQRELLKTYYGFCRAEAKPGALSDGARKQLVDVLAERIENLAGTRVSYGQQRLLVHLCSAVLSRFGRATDGAPEVKGLTKALEKYAEKADKADGFGAAIPVWLDLLNAGDGTIDTFGKASRALGHWDPLTRLRAAAFLAEEVSTDEKVGQVVLSLLNDPRDEVRAAAARVFGFAKDYSPAEVVPRMAALLTEDRGVVVQAAAAEVLIGRADQAKDQLGSLLKALHDPTRVLGSKRVSSILLVLSRLLPSATAEQRKQLLELALRNLSTSPGGALAVMEALGPEASRVVPSIREFRAAADRYRKAYIDRHVLPSILPAEPSEKM